MKILSLFIIKLIKIKRSWKNSKISCYSSKFTGCFFILQIKVLFILQMAVIGAYKLLASFFKIRKYFYPDFSLLRFSFKSSDFFGNRL